MPQGTEIHFVTWPDGKVDDATINVYSQQWAIQAFIQAFLPVRWFGDLGTMGWRSSTLWQNAMGNGFKVHTIQVPKLESLAPKPPQAE